MLINIVELIIGIYNTKLTQRDLLSTQHFAGNADQDAVVFHELNPPIRARYIRFRPVAWNKAASMRVELYQGVEGKSITYGRLVLLSFLFCENAWNEIEYSVSLRKKNANQCRCLFVCTNYRHHWLE